MIPAYETFSVVTDPNSGVCSLLSRTGEVVAENVSPEYVGILQSSLVYAKFVSDISNRLKDYSDTFKGREDITWAEVLNCFRDVNDLPMMISSGKNYRNNLETMENLCANPDVDPEYREYLARALSVIDDLAAACSVYREAMFDIQNIRPTGNVREKITQIINKAYAEGGYYESGR